MGLGRPVTGCVGRAVYNLQRLAVTRLEEAAANGSAHVLVGGWRSDAGGDYVGGLWLLEVPDRARAVALIEQDPYYLSGARQYVLRTWGKAFEEDRVVL
jgi:hypothetical protein